MEEPETQNDEQMIENIIDEADAEDEVEEFEVPKRRSKRRPRTRRRDPLNMAWCAMLAIGADAQQHLEDTDLARLQQIASPEPGKTVMPPPEVRRAVGPDLDAWILAAQVEHDSFKEKEAVQDATADEIKNNGRRPLPILNV